MVGALTRWPASASRGCCTCGAGHVAAAGRALPRLHRFLAHKWYFDEVYDLLVVRPTLAIGAWSSKVFERVVIGRLDVRHGARFVRAGNSVVRIAQSGLLRYYALLLATGVTALALYFLVVSR